MEKTKCYLDTALNNVTRRLIIEAIQESGGRNFALAARHLGVSRSRFYRLCYQLWPNLPEVRKSVREHIQPRILQVPYQTSL
jgi:DNA-binding NtrC family response regulator